MVALSLIILKKYINTCATLLNTIMCLNLISETNTTLKKL